jgi:hypothetical protein
MVIDYGNGKDFTPKGKPKADPSCGLAENIRQNMKHVRRMLDLSSQRDCQINDITHHVDTLCQQIESGQ